jgi:hypothetical protein
MARPAHSNIYFEIATVVSPAMSVALALPTQVLVAQLFDEDEL